MQAARLWMVLVFVACAALLTACPSSDKSETSEEATPVPTDEPEEPVEPAAARVFSLHFAVISDRPDVLLTATESQLEDEVDILNEHFVPASGEPLVEFEYGGMATFGDVVAGCPDLTTVLDGVDYDGDLFQDTVNACADPDVVAPTQINFFVFDKWSSDLDDSGNQFLYDHIGSHGRRNSNRPYVLIDWSRLDHNGQPAEEHEMGHGFGLDHVCDPTASTVNDPTNIMASAMDCSGSGGDRSEKFDDVQAAEIRDCAELIFAELFGLPPEIDEPHNCT